LTWECVDLNQRLLEVRAGLTQTGTELHTASPKTERGRRSVNLDPETVAILRRHRRGQLQERMLVGAAYRDQGYVFARPDGLPWMPGTVSQAFSDLVAMLPLPRITLHDLRHGYASYLLATQADVTDVSDQLGHAAAAFTLSTYAHSLPGRRTSRSSSRRNGSSSTTRCASARSSASNVIKAPVRSLKGPPR